MQTGLIELDEVKLFYLQTGAGPDIVWIPAGDQRGEEWSGQFAAFEQDFRNTSFDPRGIGETISHRPPPWTIADHAADCAGLIREVCTPPVIVAGLSLGSLIVQELCLTQPELVCTGIAMGTSGRKTGFIREWEEAEIGLRRRGETLPNDFALIHYALLMYPSEVLGDDALWAKVKPVVARAYEERDGEKLAAQWQACLDYDSLDRLKNCKVPLHVVAFSEDLQTPPSRGRLVASSAPHGHFHLLEGFGHASAFGHRPQALNACIKDIISQYV